MNGDGASHIQSSKSLRELGIDRVQRRLKHEQPKNLGGGDFAKKRSEAAGIQIVLKNSLTAQLTSSKST